MLKTILTPVDGSAHARAASLLAADLAAKYGARLILLHVGYRGGDVPAHLEERARAALEEAKREGRPTTEHPEWSPHHQRLEFMGRMILEEAGEAAAARRAERIDKVLEFGDTAERILHHAHHDHVDLIVMGSRGYSELQGLMLGSVSHKVHHLAPCTSVSVREAEKAAGADGLGKLLVATDGSDHATKAVELASDVAARYGARMVILHLLLHNTGLDELRKLVDLDRLSPTARDQLQAKGGPFSASPVARLLPPLLPEAVLQEVGQQILERARAAAASRNVSGVDLVLDEGDPAQAILRHAERQKADLIVMGSRGLGELKGLLIGSASNKVSHLARCATMVVR